MRLDVYLKTTQLVPRRSGATDLCRDGKVKVNGRPAKAARTVGPGDRITFRLPGREISVEVVALPARKNVPKAEAGPVYTVLDEKRFDFWGRPIKKKE
jgi:ribosomal 50S subunit-recycling heat shock protein